MIIRKAPRPRGWTTVPNATLEDARLSFRARGLLAYLLSRPEGWETDSERLSKVGKEGREAVRTALNELATHGYLVRRKTQGERGLWRTDTWVYDTPVTDDEAAMLDGLAPDEPSPPAAATAENPTVDKPVEEPVEDVGITDPPKTGFRASENRALLTTNINHEDPASQRNHRATSSPPVDNSDAGSAVDALSQAVSDGEEIDELSLAPLEAEAIRWIQTAAPGVPPFALRAHLVALDAPASFAFARVVVEHALSVIHKPAAAVTIADVIGATAKHLALTPTWTALRAAALSAASGGHAPAGAGVADDSPARTSGSVDATPSVEVTEP